ncbi:hypothetical protein PRIC1_004436 [Phytophthora ramorum]
MDELQSVGLGLALGLVVVSFLALYPGEPFDYTTNCPDGCDNEHRSSSAANTISENDQLISSETPLAAAIGENQEQQIAAIEQAAQRVKIQKLQELLGLEKEKAEQLVQRAKDEAVDAVAADGRSPSSSYSASSTSAWLDRGFFAVMFGLLAWVLWQDYGINLLSVAAHMFPREAEVVYQVVAAPRGFLAQVVAMWE